MTAPRDLIPHRPPFLLLDAVTALDGDHAEATACARAADPWWAAIFAGHYPGEPVVPGVLLCEMTFQAGAALMGRRLESSAGAGVPILARIRQAKFRRMVRPDEPLVVTADYVDRAGPAFFLKGAVKADGKPAVQTEFSVTLAQSMHDA